MKCQSYPTHDTLGFLASDPTPSGIPKQKKQLKKGLTKTFKSLQFQQSDGKYDVTVQFNAGSESLVLEFMDKSDTRTFYGKFNKETIRRITRECPLSVANLSEVIKDQLSSTDFINKFCRLFEFKNLYHATSKRRLFSTMSSVPNLCAIVEEDDGKMDEGKMEEGGTVNGAMETKGYALFLVHFSPSKYIRCNYCFVLEEGPLTDTERFMMKLNELKEENMKFRADMKRIAGSQFAELKTENEDLIQKNGQLRSELDAVKSTINALVQNQEKSHRTLQRLTQSVQQSNETNTALGTSLKTTNDTIDTLRQSVEDTNRRVDTFREELQKENKALTERNEQSNQSIAGLRTELNVLSHSVEDANDMLDNLNEKVNVSRKELKESTDAGFAELNKKNEELVERNGALKTAFDAVIDALVQHQEQSDRAIQEIKQRVDEEVADLREVNEVLWERNEQSNEAIQGLKQSAHQSNETIIGSKTELSTTSDALRESAEDATNEVMDNLNGRVGSHEDELKDSTNEQFTELKEQNEDLTERLQTELDAAKTSIEFLEHDVAALKQSVLGLNAMNGKLISELKRSTESLTQNMRTIKNSVEGVKRDLNQKTQVQTRALPMNNGWETYGGSHQATAQKIGNVVHLRGLVKGDPNNGNSYALKLPGGWRPPTRQNFACSYNETDGRCTILVFEDGDLYLYGSPNRWFRLDGITFVVD